ncbi:MAG TPA: hypothetical protein VK817_18730 [Trebonia sp.]|jgi:succinate dehydrogenase/fumarate reductase cytochrome b subunit|nr:hypothetical protein [Trebonia sp.]
MATETLKLPRDSTRQSAGIVYGRLSKTVNRAAGGIIIGFVVVHVVGLSVVYWSALRPVLHLMPWLSGIQFNGWFHLIYVILFPAAVYHTLYSLKLILMDFGLRTGYRWTFWTISGLAAASAVWGGLGYVSH